MGSISRLRWIGLAAVGLIAPGCLILPYGIPTIDRVAEIQVVPASDEVHAFRVDGETTVSRVLFGCGYYGGNPTTNVWRLKRVDCGGAGIIDSQWNVGIDRGRLYVGLLNGIPDKTYHTLAIHLYRPGYETTRIPGGDEPEELMWKPVAGIAGYEEAVDDLIGYRDARGVFSTHKTSLAPGGSSAAHREALLFCAAEYERIAEMILEHEPDREEAHARLLRKAKRMRELAEKNLERS